MLASPLAPELACPYPPGDPLKVACLRLRHERRLPLWHPGDRQEGARRVKNARPEKVARVTMPL